MGSSGPKRRKAKRPLPRIPKYERYPRNGMRWRMGGPLTRDHEPEALAAQRAKPMGRLGRFVLRLLGGRDRSR